MIGTQVQQFRVLEKLGEGGMGEVFIAEDTRLKRRVALKFLPPHYSRDEEFKARFEHEATAAAALNHPNIVTVHELGAHEGRPFIAMEYVEGLSLDKVIKAGDIRIDKAVRIALQACEGLSAAHEAGIVHRDIKPGNIMIDKSGRVKILDFGLAKSRQATADTQAGVTVGTVQYESPEQGRGDAVDQRSDLFSVGIVLYEMIAGRLPFTGEFAEAIRYAIANENPEPLARYKSDVPDDLQRIVSKLLEKDQELRYQNAAGVISDLKLLERDSGSRVSAAYSSAYRPQAGKRRWQKILVSGSALALLVLLAVIFEPWRFRVTPGRDAGADGNRLAVMYFDNLSDPGDTRRLGEITANLLITDLSQSTGVRVVSSQRLYDLLKQLGHEGIKSINRDIATQVAERAHSRWMLTGSILKTDPNIILTAQLVDTESGNTVASQRVDGAEGEEIFALVDSLSARIRLDLALPAREKSGTERSVADVTTGSTEAYRHYLEGIELRNKFFHHEAMSHFLQAVALDSAFAMAYYRLLEMGAGTRAQKTEWLAKAMAHAGRASPKEQEYIHVARAMSEPDYTEAARRLQGIIRDYPEEKDAYRELAGIYRSRRLDDSTIWCLQRVIEFDPLDKNAYNELAYAYDRVGQFDRAAEAVNRYVEVAPDEPNPYDSRGDIYAYNGRFGEAADSYRRALELKPDYLNSLRKLGDMYLFTRDYARAESSYTQLIARGDAYQRAEGRLCLAVVPAYSGRFSRALEVLDDGIAADRLERIAGVEPVLKYGLKAILQLEVQDREAAASAARAAYESLFAMRRQYPEMLKAVAWLEAAAGNEQMADSLLGKLEELCTDATDSVPLRDLRLGRAMVEVARDRAREAAQLFGLASVDDRYRDFGVQYLAGLAYLQADQLEDAVPRLEAALTRYDPNWLIGVTARARAHYLLGLAYERSGWKRQAIARYEEFLELWKDADPGIAEVEDARRRLSELQT